MIDFRMPSMGADMDEGMLVAWLVSPGDTVSRGQIIAEIESDKGIIEAECWQEGVVEELLVEPGPAVLRVGTPLARLRPLAVDSPEPEPVPVPATATPHVSPEEERIPAAVTGRVTPPVRHLARELGVDVSTLPSPVTRKGIIEAAGRRTTERPRATPLARRRADELGVDLSTLRTTRPDGIITASDVVSPPESPRAARQDEPQETATAGPVEPTDVSEPAPADDRRSAMRRAVARSMARSKREIPHYYLGTHIDLGNALRWLDDLNAERGIGDRVLPAVLLLRATALALREVPELNGHHVDGVFQPLRAVHLGVAVSLREGGLVAPAIHDADSLDLDQLMAALRDLVTRARSWRIRSSEMSDPTITVTNLGDRGVETAFPVIIPPQVAIVGFGKVSEQPVAIDGMLAVRPLVHATLAADHRVSDGHRGGLFLDALDRLLQRPEDL